MVVRMYSWQTFRRQSIRYLSSDRCIDAMLDAGRCRWITRALSSRFGANIALARAEVNITFRLVEVDIAFRTNRYGKNGADPFSKPSRY